jgi:hypothetical protein
MYICLSKKQKQKKKLKCVICVYGDVPYQIYELACIHIVALLNRMIHENTRRNIQGKCAPLQRAQSGILLAHFTII